MPSSHPYLGLSVFFLFYLLSDSQSARNSLAQLPCGPVLLFDKKIIPEGAFQLFSRVSSVLVVTFSSRVFSSNKSEEEIL